MVKSDLKRKASEREPRPSTGGKVPKFTDEQVQAHKDLEAQKRALEEQNARLREAVAKQAEQEAPSEAVPPIVAAADAKPAAKKPGKKPLQRLYPSAVRQQPDDAGTVAHPRSIERVNLEKAPMAKLEEMYILSTANANVVKSVEFDDMKEYIALPAMAVGQASDLLAQKKNGVHWSYQQKPLVRGIHPNSDFEANLKNNKFSSTKAILVVPCLTVPEETQYLADPTKFRESMLLDSFFHKRYYWIVDGATRWTLCMRSGFLGILFPLYSTERVQVQVRTSIHGARSLCSRKCCTPVCDVPERGNLYKFDYSFYWWRKHTGCECQERNNIPLQSRAGWGKAG